MCQDRESIIIVTPCLVDVNSSHQLSVSLCVLMGLVPALECAAAIQDGMGQRAHLVSNVCINNDNKT